MSAYDEFEGVLHRLFGKKVRASEEFSVGYTFRSAGYLIAEIRGGGDYMDWYCFGPDGVVSGEISAAMTEENWRWSLYD